MEHILNIGYEEVSHTADWSVKVWAANLPELFSECMAAMLHMMRVEYLCGQSVEHIIDLQALDAESLLVAFLNEILFMIETRGLVPVEKDIFILGNTLHGVFQCMSLQAMKKEIKAVTFHNLKIEKKGESIEVVLVFDV
jgi:SHS2 domain-containing protein